MRASTRTEIVNLQRKFGITTLYVTHDQAEAMTMASRIAVMIAGEIVQLGTAKDVYDCPVNERVALFIGTPHMNLLAGEVAAGRVRVDGCPIARARILPRCREWSGADRRAPGAREPGTTEAQFQLARHRAACQIASGPKRLCTFVWPTHCVNRLSSRVPGRMRRPHCRVATSFCDSPGTRSICSIARADAMR